MADIPSVIKDTAYVGIGLGVLAVQKAQVYRQELLKTLRSGDGFEKIGTTVEEQLKTLEERLEGLQEQVDSAVDSFQDQLDKVLDEVEERLPEQARDLFHTARSAARDASGQLRELVHVRTRTAA